MKKKEAKSIVKNMTLEEKASLLSGKDAWSTVPVERLGVPSINLSDGPNGLRKCGGLGNVASVPATCFPAQTLLACGWDEELAKKQGEALGEEAQAQDVQLLLGPGNNIKRSPLCGRNFEYLSEDPYLSGRICAGIIKGVQSKGVGATLKHFAANSQETDRFGIDEYISPRALREIYLASFEYTVKEAKPAAMMCAYNSVNGQFCSQSRFLLTDVLRKEWGYKGAVMSDWGAVDNRPQGVYAGLDLEMPSSGGINTKEIIKAVKGEKVTLPSRDKKFKNKLKEKQVDKCAARITKLAFDLDATKTGAQCDYDEHRRLAAEIARECMVLLKNDGMLPLSKGGRVAVLGEMAVKPRYQGSGSSRVNSIAVTAPLEAISAHCEAIYSQGYKLDDGEDISLVAEAVSAAASADCAVIVCGLPDSSESEGYDRTHIDIPRSHLELIYQVRRVQQRVAVVLCNGAPVAMPFLGDVNAVLEAYLGGDGAGDAIADLLFGEANPCGKLAETFPLSVNHTPCFGNFPGVDSKVYYAEDVMVGYRWYNSRRLPVLFPFGYGLSYTRFTYEDIEVSSDNINADDGLTVTVTVRNTGAMDGKEIVQLYVGEDKPMLTRPERELKGFKKVFIRAGEAARVEFKLDRRSFAYWDEENHCWAVDSGIYTVMAGANSVDCPLYRKISVKGRTRCPKLTVYSEFRFLRTHPSPKAKQFAKEICDNLGFDINNTDDGTGSFASLDYAILRTVVTMMSSGITMEEMLERLDEINKA